MRTTRIQRQMRYVAATEWEQSLECNESGGADFVQKVCLVVCERSDCRAPEEHVFSADERKTRSPLHAVCPPCATDRWSLKKDGGVVRSTSIAIEYHALDLPPLDGPRMCEVCGGVIWSSLSAKGRKLKDRFLNNMIVRSWMMPMLCDYVRSYDEEAERHSEYCDLPAVDKPRRQPHKS